MELLADSNRAKNCLRSSLAACLALGRTYALVFPTWSVAAPSVSPTLHQELKPQSSVVSPGPKRLVSCSLASDEILLELLRRAHALDRLVALSALVDDVHFSNVTVAAQAIRGRCGGELESLLSLRPDLVILASYNRPEWRARLTGAHIAMHVLENFTSLNDLATHIRGLGDLVGATAAANDLVREFSTVRAEVRAEVSADSKMQPQAPKPTLLQFYQDGTVAGSGTLFDDLVHEAGGINAAAALGIQGWAQLSPERLLALNPSALIAGGPESSRATMLANLRSMAGWRELPAVKSGHLILLPEAELGATSQFAAVALKDLHRAVRDLQTQAGTLSNTSK